MAHALNPSTQEAEADWTILGQQETECKSEIRRIILERGRAESESHWQTQRGICECRIQKGYVTEHKQNYGEFKCERQLVISLSYQPSIYKQYSASEWLFGTRQSGQERSGYTILYHIKASWFHEVSPINCWSKHLCYWCPIQKIIPCDIKFQTVLQFLFYQTHGIWLC